MNIKLRNMASIYISKDDKMLMLYRIGSSVVPPSWCGIGGHFEEYELNDARACALRKLKEEMNISEGKLDDLQLKYVTLRLKDNEIRQNYYFFADLKPNAIVNLICNEGKPEWIQYEHILEKEMPYTAKYVLQHYLKIGKYSNHIYGGMAALKNVVFTELIDF
ncbi:MAG: NUDIX domain-containing protein [Lachnospiraceae bacterium]|nr:NUDIX domain-containing protein [Lachnospiraceae bacterium]